MLAERQVFGIRYVDLAKVQRVRLLANRVGGAYLAAEDREGRWAGCQVLIIGLYNERHLSAEMLDLICAALEKSREEPSALAVRAKLQEQARYLRTGQDVAGSPLRTHSEWIPGGLGIPQQEVAQPHSRNPFATVRRDDPRAPDDGVR